MVERRIKSPGGSTTYDLDIRTGAEKMVDLSLEEIVILEGARTDYQAMERHSHPPFTSEKEVFESSIFRPQYGQYRKVSTLIPYGPETSGTIISFV